MAGGESTNERKPDGRVTLEGRVERVTFHSEATGFSVLRVKAPGRGELATVVGTTAVVHPGEQVQCEGGWVTDRTHGVQFKADVLRVIPPSTLEGIEKYLSSGMVRGIGPHFARKLVATFGREVFHVIEHEPERLTELAGIGAGRKKQITDAWAEHMVVRDIMVFLQSHGVGTARALRIYRTYGHQSVERVRANPYRLALDIRGIGFPTADSVARQLGVPTDSPARASAGVRHVLQQLAEQGHCAGRVCDVAKSAAELLDIDRSVTERSIETEVKHANLVTEAIDGEPCLFLPALHHAEAEVASQLRRLSVGEVSWGIIDTRKAIPWAEARTQLSLSSSQRAAVAIAVQSKVAVITGGPGVGKTTVVNTIFAILRAKGAQLLLCAPTGRAAKRLSQSTGMEAKTIHRLLEFDPKSFDFKRNGEYPLDADLLVVDEASMVDITLMSKLLRSVPDQAALLLVGDVDQLPSVGPGAVLGDIIDCGAVPVARLTEVFRQAESSRIVVNAHRINQGLMPERTAASESTRDFFLTTADGPDAVHRKLMQLLTERIPKRFGLDPVRDIQVLTPMNRGGLGARALNLELQQRLNPDSAPRVNRFGWSFAPGDKVIQTTNNYDKEVFNGDIGRIARVDPEQALVCIDYDGREVTYEAGELDELSLAYATTVHKSQGSEYPAVLIPLAAQHYMLLQRNLLYTAVTRGKQLVVIVAEPKAMAMAVRNGRANRRLTNLRNRLRDAKADP
ncbi:MAG: ATP-dependent RecD-like DNA helicase [Gammaproteobacteria bacterium]|nr:ATP-dependent RecD-like DNA helicase [Gammaproteobacteria bacterium]